LLIEAVFPDDKFQLWSKCVIETGIWFSDYLIEDSYRLVNAEDKILFGVCSQLWDLWLLIDFLLLCGQRPLFYSFKMGLPLAIKRALKLSNVAYLCSAALLVFLPDQFKSGGTMGQFITEQIILYIGSFSVFLCWELSHHLHQVSINVLIVFYAFCCSLCLSKTIT